MGSRILPTTQILLLRGLTAPKRGSLERAATPRGAECPLLYNRHIKLLPSYNLQGLETTSSPKGPSTQTQSTVQYISQILVGPHFEAVRALYFGTLDPQQRGNGLGTATWGTPKKYWEYDKGILLLQYSWGSPLGVSMRAGDSSSPQSASGLADP